MPLELILDSLDAIEEPQRTLYVERNGKFHLDVSGLPDTAKLTRALESERKTARELQEKLRGYSGVDPERYTQLEREATERAAAETERQRKEAEARGEFDRVTKEREDAHKRALEEATAASRKALADKDAEVATLRLSMQRDKLDAEATRAIVGARGVAELLLPHVKSQCQVADRNGVMVVEVLDGEGKPRTRANGELFTLTDLVDEMSRSEVYSRAFEPEGRRGTGSGNGTGGGGGAGTMSAEMAGKLSLSEYRKARDEGRIA